MSQEVILSLVSLAGSLVLALVAALNLFTSRQLLVRVSRQLEIAENQSEMTLIRNAFIEMSEFLQIFVEKPHLRPFFYDNKPTPSGDELLDAEVAAMAEWILTNFATAISLAVMLPEYPIGALKETIRFHLRNSPAMRKHLEDRFTAFPVTGMTLLRWTYETKAETSQALELYAFHAKERGDNKEELRLLSLQRMLDSAKEDADLLFASAGLADSRAGTIPVQ